MIAVAVLALVLALLGIAFGFTHLVLVSLVSLTFSLASLVFYFVVGVSSGLALLLSGSLLDRRLHDELTAFVTQDGPSPLRDRGLTRAFGLLVLTLLPYLLYLQAFTLYGALTSALAIWRIVIEPSRAPAVVFLVPAFIVVGTLAGIAIGLFFLVVPANVEPVGIALTPRDNPRLWQLSRSSAQAVGTRPADTIVLTPGPGIGVSMPAGLFHSVFGGERTLQIGLPSLCGLRIGELAAVLTHEYGHLGHRDTQWAAFIQALNVSLLATLATVPGPQAWNEQPILVALVTSLNPAYWTFRLFVALFFRITSGFSRARETLADLEAASCFGGKTFARALLRVAANDVVFHELVEKRDVPSLLLQGEVIPGFVEWMDLIYREELGSDGLADLEYRLLAVSEQHDPYDLHPGLEERINATERLPAEESADDRPVSVLFDDWQETDEMLTRLYYDAHGLG